MIGFNPQSRSTTGCTLPEGHELFAEIQGWSNPLLLLELIIRGVINSRRRDYLLMFLARIRLAFTDRPRASGQSRTVRTYGFHACYNHYPSIITTKLKWSFNLVHNSASVHILAQPFLLAAWISPHPIFKRSIYEISNFSFLSFSSLMGLFF